MFNETDVHSSPAPEDRKRQLYERQRAMLGTLLEHGAISRAQYDKSLGDLKEKMGYDDMEDPSADP